jgi:4-alpha-glucanotransferase
MEQDLNRLMDAAGVEARYWDIAGRLHETSPETARRLLDALGFPASTQTEIEASLVAAKDNDWRERSPPVIVATELHDINVPIRSSATTRHLRWMLDLEQGMRVSGEVSLDNLAVEATGVLAGVPVVLRRVRLPPQPSGYHRLRLEADAQFASDLVVAPACCYLPPGTRRHWGIAAQLYALRSANNWGIGDFTDLGRLMGWAGSRGASTVGVNPLHALFLDTPQDASPYSPNSRLFLNPLYLDVTAIPDFRESAEARGLASHEFVGAARAGSVVEYPAVAAAKLAVLEQLYAHFSTVHCGENSARGRAYRQFLSQGGSDLRHFATFEMLREQYGTHDWTRWPESSRKPDAGKSYSSAQMRRADFFAYLQWQCAIQLAAAVAGVGDMPLGLYNDLAVSVDAASADHWANQDVFVSDARVGAPPDPFNEKGQDWGLVPFHPRRLRASGYAHFIALLRANMRHAGVLRIDHAMGWQRLFLVPRGAPAYQGAYVRFPLDDILAIAALESQRNKCMLIGEDLGTVPAGFRERMMAAKILSCRILYFERDGERFRRPDELPVLAAAATATHDLATLRGYWTGEDISAKARIGILNNVQEAQFRAERAHDKYLLLQALAKEGLHDAGDDAPWTPDLTRAIQAYLARSPCLLFMIQLDDLANDARQTNLPGSTTEYPNWRQRLDLSLDEMISEPSIARTLATIARERGMQS